MCRISIGVQSVLALEDTPIMVDCNRAADKKQPLTAVKTTDGSRWSVAYVPDTTMAFKGNRKMFKMAPCRASGTYLERSVPATGMNRPTQNSTTKKLTNTMSVHWAVPEKYDDKQRTGTPMLAAAMK